MKQYVLLFIGDSIDVGGAGKMLKYVSNEMSHLFNKVYLYSVNQRERPVGLNDNVTFLCNPFEANYSLLGRFRTIRAIRNTVKKVKPTFVCSFNSEMSSIVRFSTLGLPSIIVSAERGDPYTLPLKWKLMVKWAYHKSDACIFQLAKARDYFNKTIRNKSYVIPNPFILSNPIPVYKGERNKTIVSAGRFVPEKGFDILIDAFAIVHESYPEYKLVIWGEGPLYKEYKQQIEKLGLTELISFPGYSKNVAESVKTEGIFVLSSRYEGIPNVLLEAMSVGIPVVATNCSPGGPEFLTNNGERGLIVPMDDSEAMANAIISLIEDKKLYERMENQGPEIRNVLDKEKITKQWESVINDIIERKTLQKSK